MTVEIPKDQVERAQAQIDAAEAIKPQPAMTDEMRAEVLKRQAEMIGQSTAQGAQEAADAMRDLKQVAEQAAEPAVRAEAGEVVRVNRGRSNTRAD